jgi:hypothetical protein
LTARSHPWAAWGLPVPEAEVRFHPARRWRLDFGWADPKGGGVALEVDGGVWIQGRHSRGAGQVADMEKANAAQLAGWLILRCTPQQLKSGEIVATIREALISRGMSGDQELAGELRNKRDKTA